MIKKTLLKTLLPITSVALIGGGIASSLTLTSCSNKKVIIKSQKQAIEYLLKNAVILPSGKYEYVINETSNKKEIKESDAALFYNKILSAYNKQSYINSMVANACFRNIEGHSFFKIGGALAIENNKLEMDFENGSNLYSIVYDISEFEKINKYDLISIEYANGIPIGDPTSNY
ncbi:MAG: hypothetical protein LBB45_02040 [Methanobrevibacter sp.]|jgi:hypothetical protein|nr:hypothetical protein [Candidatus Methanovirga basalitermitum]